MADIKLNNDHDIEIANNDVSIITGTEEVRQRLVQNLRSFQGNWFLNLKSGVSYFQNIFRKDYNIEVVNTILKNAILNTLGVLELLSFELDIDDGLRKLSLSFTVRTIDENITIQEAVIL